MKRMLLLVAAAALAPLPARGQAVAVAADSTRVLGALWLEGAAPEIDGRLDDAAWQRAVPSDEFTQRQPRPNTPASERTEVRVAHDGRALYVAVRLFDSAPDSIVGQLARRDAGVHSDWVYVALDSYRDRRTAFAFGVNPRGVERDVLLSDDTREDAGWDAVWDGAARVDSLGWTAEFRIPLSQLRFAARVDGERVWGVNVRRHIARRGETSYWAPLPADAPVPSDGLGQVSRFGELRGLSISRSPQRVELQPYTAARYSRKPGVRADPFYNRDDVDVRFGGDLKYALTPGLTLNATINPDFGQVEADPSEVNLSAFETLYAEKRPFFAEGADIFRLSYSAQPDLFYSRRVGRAPQGSLPAAAVFRDAPTASTILGAAKLSGKTAGGWSLGFLSALTAEEEGRFADTLRVTRTAVVEPMSGFAVARAVRDFRGGQSALGAIVTAAGRRLEGTGLDRLAGSALAGGADFRHRYGRGNYEVAGSMLGSYVAGERSAILALQNAPARYFGRPGAGHVEVDSARTSLAGASAALRVAKIGGGHWRWTGTATAVTPGYEINDLGYQREADALRQSLSLGYVHFQPGRVFRRWSLGTGQFSGWSMGGDRILTSNNLQGSFQLRNLWEGSGGITRHWPAFSTTELRGGPSLRTPGNVFAFANLASDPRRGFGVRLNGSARVDDSDGGRQLAVTPGIAYRPSPQADVSLDVHLSRYTNPAQYVTRRVVAGTPHYLMAQLEMTTASLTGRLNYTFTPTLSFQLYAQPFVSAGEYSRLRVVDDPRASAFGDRFHTLEGGAVVYDPEGRQYALDVTGDGRKDAALANPDFSLRQLRSTAVLRWEYGSGSTLFVVWSPAKSVRGTEGRFDLGRDFSGLLRGEGENVLTIKLNYWLGL